MKAEHVPIYHLKAGTSHSYNVCPNSFLPSDPRLLASGWERHREWWPSGQQDGLGAPGLHTRTAIPETHMQVCNSSLGPSIGLGGSKSVLEAWTPKVSSGASALPKWSCRLWLYLVLCVYYRQEKRPGTAGELRVVLMYCIWWYCNYDFYENHVFRRQSWERLLIFIVLPGNRKSPSCSDAKQSFDLPPETDIC